MIVEVEVAVDRPAEAVYDATADARNEPTWNSQVSSTVLLTDLPFGPGSWFATVVEGSAGT